MNNEPVAWMDEINTFVLDKDYQQFPKSLQHGMIPLYTHPVNPKYDPETGEPLIDGYPLFSGLPHPVKEQDTDCQYCKQGCIRCDARKQLTDEEIYQTWVEAKNTALNTRGSDFVEVIFARAILRKASEK